MQKFNAPEIVADVYLPPQREDKKQLKGKFIVVELRWEHLGKRKTIFFAHKENVDLHPELATQMQEFNVASWGATNCFVEGGGWFEFYEHRKEIRLGGSSVTYGKYGSELVHAILSRALPGYKILHEVFEGRGLSGL